MKRKRRGSYASLHNHTDFSNIRLRDSINKVKRLIDTAYDKGLSSIAITDHEFLGAYVKAKKHYLAKYKDKDFRVLFGNEIYLVDGVKEAEAIDKGEYFNYNHFILLAKNEEGFKALKKLSTQAWKNKKFYKALRVPTYKSYFQQIIQQYPNSLIASTACLGGELPKLILDGKTNEALEFIQYMKDLFHDDFYLELQPSNQEEQKRVNAELLRLGELTNTKCIVTTDSHYYDKKSRFAHKIYLNSSEGEREVDDFYETTYLMSYNELLEYFDNETLKVLCDNTLEIEDKIQEFSLQHSLTPSQIIIPMCADPHIIDEYIDQYEYIKKYNESPYWEDRLYLYMIEKGFKKFNEPINHTTLDRVNTELKEVWLTSEKENERISRYFVNTTDLIDLLWDYSVVGPARGSASCFYTNYLLGIVQINALKYDLPHWRFMTHERPGMPDIDIDSSPSARPKILEGMKRRYGYDKVLTVGTFTTEGARQSIKTACKGLGIDKDIANQLSAMAPNDKGIPWPLSHAFYGAEEYGRKPDKAFIAEIAKYEGLREVLEDIEGVISGLSQHASGVVIFPSDYRDWNAMAQTTAGQHVTQFDLHDSEYMGAIKYDMLTVAAMERIQNCIEILKDYNRIEWQGTLRETYNKYFHPDVLNTDDPDMFDKLFNKEIDDVFQFSGVTGDNALRKINARNFEQLCAANSLMRLSVQEGELPIDRYIRYKNNIEDWYTDMRNYGLNEDEINVAKRYLLHNFGICDNQEDIMRLSLDKDICGLSLTDANKLRKTIACKDSDAIFAFYQHYAQIAESNGVRKVMYDYIWHEQFALSFMYAFSKPHNVPYTYISLIEMNICHFYGDIYWKLACLQFNAGLVGDQVKGVDYAAIVSALYKTKEKIKHPNINLSDKGFKIIDDYIYYGLISIKKIGEDIVDTIIQNRPYKSLTDFYNKTQLSENVMLNLIKAGCFNDFGPVDKMLFEYVSLLFTDKKSLSTVQLAKYPNQFIKKIGYEKEIELVKFRKNYFAKDYKETAESLAFLKKLLSNFDYTVDEKGQVKVEKKVFDKWFNEELKEFKKVLKKPEILEQYRNILRNEFWGNNCLGTKEQFEMDTCMYYFDKHIFDTVNISDYFNITDFNTLPEVAKYREETNSRGKVKKIFEICDIAGTVIKKDKNKCIVTLLTQYGVVNCKFGKGAFLKYDKKVVDIQNGEKTVLDTSWFEPGTHLVVRGMRQEQLFFPRKNDYSDTTVRKININHKKQIGIVTNKLS